MCRAAVANVSVLLLCMSCGAPAIDPSTSLVGAKTLPSEAALSSEIIYIRLGGGPDGGHSLTYELRPDDSLSITHKFSDYRSAANTVKGQETFRMSRDSAMSVRRLFWRVRPEKLDFPDGEHRPMGCTPIGSHDFGEVSIMFHAKGRTSSIEDNPMGQFRLPYADGCKTPAAAEAREVVWRAIHLLPASKTAAAYERDRARELRG